MDGTLPSSLKMAVQHSAASVEWYSPAYLRDAAFEWMGSIDLDPASSSVANKHIGASVFFDEAKNGLAQPWFGNVFLNPPTPPRQWWERSVYTTIARETENIFYVSYSVEPLSQSQQWTPQAPMVAFSVCIPRRRIRYLCTASDAAAKLSRRLEKRLERTGAGATKGELKKLDGYLSNPDALVAGDAPPHASAIIGVGPDHDGFAKALRSIGAVMRGTGRRAA